MSTISETTTNIIAEGTIIEGKIAFDNVSRVHGTLKGDVIAIAGSKLVLAETAVVEGNIQADDVMIDGYVKGDIAAKTRVVISGTGRVLGNIKTPSLKVDFGGFFEGRASMEEQASTKQP
jgi:cytoskeletal protein CcmA (bactofilin family)